MASLTAQEVNRVELAKTIGVKWETVDTYLDILKRLMLVIEVQAWRSGETRREVKQSKFHFLNTGMNCALRGLDEGSFKLGSHTINQLDGLLESFVFNELLRMIPFQSNEYRLYHWRSAEHRAIDIIVEDPECLVGIKVKASSTVTNDDFKHIKWFKKNNPGITKPFREIVLYQGSRILPFGDNCFVLPVSSLWPEIKFIK